MIKKLTQTLVLVTAFTGTFSTAAFADEPICVPVKGGGQICEPDDDDIIITRPGNRVGGVSSFPSRFQPEPWTVRQPTYMVKTPTFKRSPHVVEEDKCGFVGCFPPNGPVFEPKGPSRAHGNLQRY